MLDLDGAMLVSSPTYTTESIGYETSRLERPFAGAL